MKSKDCSCGEQGILRSILSGSLRTRDKLYRAELVASPICIFCGLAAETLQHMWWHCPAWKTLRYDPNLPSEACRREQPPCTQNLGIAMEDDECIGFQQQEPCGAEVECPAELPGSIDEEMMCDDRVIAWTDGACKDNQDARFRRAGAGVFYCKSSARNQSIALSGREQTNQRAELLAVVHVLRSEQRAVEIRTDSEYVHNGARSWQRWAAAGWQGDHKDLWSELAALMAQRPEGSATFVKVVGHAKDSDVQSGAVQQCDKDGNDAADKLATWAAAQHEAPADLVWRAASRRAMTSATQKMMVKIIERRAERERQLTGGGQMLHEVSSSEDELNHGSDLPHSSLPSETDPG